MVLYWNRANVINILFNKIIDTSDIIKSEQDIFDYLKIPFVLPEKRDNIE